MSYEIEEILGSLEDRKEGKITERDIEDMLVGLHESVAKPLALQIKSSAKIYPIGLLQNVVRALLVNAQPLGDVT